MVYLFASVIPFKALATFSIFLCYKNIADERSVFRNLVWRQSTQREAFIEVHLILRTPQTSFFVSLVSSIFINVQRRQAKELFQSKTIYWTPGAFLLNVHVYIRHCVIGLEINHRGFDSNSRFTVK